MSCTGLTEDMYEDFKRVTDNWIPCTCNDEELEPYCPRHTPLPGTEQAVSQPHPAQVHWDEVEFQEDIDRAENEGM